MNVYSAPLLKSGSSSHQLTVMYHRLTANKKWSRLLASLDNKRLQELERLILQESSKRAASKLIKSLPSLNDREQNLAIKNHQQAAAQQYFNRLAANKIPVSLNLAKSKVKEFLDS